MRASRAKRESALHLVFDLGVVLKGIDGVLEVLGAGLLAFASPQAIASWVSALTAHELSQDPHDFIAIHLLAAARHLSVGEEAFASLYLLSHGVLKILLVWALLAKKLWAYPLAIGVFVAFAVYQTYRYTLTHSTGMIALTALDVVVIILTWIEYGRLKRRI